MQENFKKNKDIGNAGESLAAKYLIKQGFKIVGRNVRYRRGEIDIIARRGKELHFVEVRTRTDPDFVPPLETITETKKKKIRKTAEIYLNDSRNNFKSNALPQCHFSVIGIDYAHGEPRIECILDAFD